jgi:pyruvate dehydrogenase E2 component (dihydrolipoamide acetyltransferase)
MSIETVRIPDIGDTSEVEVIELCVAPGDRVAVDDALIVIESDKASMDVPSPVAGVVRSLALAVGDHCSEGAVVAEIETQGGSDAEASAPEADRSAAKAVDADASADADAASKSGSDEAGPTAAAESEDAEVSVVEVRIPDVGDAGDVEVVELMVAVGDQVEEDDGLVALESDKATMEVPSPVAGRVQSLEVKTGDSVSEGTLVARIETSAAVGSRAESSPSPKAEETVRAQTASPQAAPSRSPESTSTEARSAESTAPRPPSPPAAESATDARVYAGPAVRRLARELGVDLGRVSGSGARGRILKEDVHGFVKAAMTGGGAAASTGSALPAMPVVDFSRYGEIEQTPLSRLMKNGAANLHRAWLNVPHVTQHDDADVTELEAFRRALKPEAEQAGVKLTPLPFLLKAAAAALAAFPRVNGSFAGDGEHYVLKKYVHIGFAVDTPEGLLVPVIRDVDRKGLFALAEEITELSERARALRLKPDEMRGGCFSISSLGAIGGTGFTPIVNAPEVAILGVSRLVRKPVWDGSAFVPRDMLPLSLSYDHRAINGAEAGRFLSWYVAALADMRRLLL